MSKEMKNTIIQELDHRIALLGKTLEEKRHSDEPTPLAEIIGVPLKRELEEIKSFVEGL